MKKIFHFLLKKIKSRGLPIYIGLLYTSIIFLADTVPIPFLSSLVNQLDNWTYDQIVSLHLRPQPINPKVVIINIDNKSEQQEGRWPWPRSKLADLINKLKQYGVVTIGTDIVMTEPEVNNAMSLIKELQQFAPRLVDEQKKLPVLLNTIATQVDHDKIFANSLHEHNVVLGYLFHDDRQIKAGVLPQPLTAPNGIIFHNNHSSFYQFSGYNGCLPLFLKASTQAGSVTNLLDLDETVRHGFVVESYDNALYASLSLAVAMNYLMVDHITLKWRHHQLYGIQMGGVFIPTTSKGQILIPFWGGPGTLNYFSASDVLQGKVNPDALQGAIAVIGSTMILLADLHDSPVGPLFPGVEMVGNMIRGIVSQQLVTPYDWGNLDAKIYLVLIGLLFTFLFSFLNEYILLLVALICILGLWSISILLFVLKSLYLPLGFIIVLITFLAVTNYVYLFIKERQQKRKINQLFGQYVPEAYVKELIESSEQYNMEGQEREMTVLFSDIRNFTSLSETMIASNVKKLLNAFFTPITELIFSYRGTIDKYVGDMIVAFWNAPIPDEEHISHAILCSLEIIKKLPEINARMLDKNLPTVTIGIGLASGLMNVGDMGSEFRRAYTVIGDTVNLASRLQDLTKFYQITILVSDKTRLSQDQFIWRTIDKITVKGRKKGLTIYQPLGKVNEVSEKMIIELEEYHHALNDYYAQKWSIAEKKFSMLQDKYPTVYLYQIYLERIKTFIKEPPANDWNGIYHEH